VALGQLSNAQIEAVVYAFMRFDKRLQNGMCLLTKWHNALAHVPFLSRPSCLSL